MEKSKITIESNSYLGEIINHSMFLLEAEKLRKEFNIAEIECRQSDRSVSDKSYTIYVNNEERISSSFGTRHIVYLQYLSEFKPITKTYEPEIEEIIQDIFETIRHSLVWEPINNLDNVPVFYTAEEIFEKGIIPAIKKEGITGDVEIIIK
jgi:hypothetical protein